MGDTLRCDFKGLVTAPGRMMRPEPSFSVTTNALFPVPGLAEKRLGFKRLGDPNNPIFKLLTSRLMGANVLAHTGGSSSGGTALHYGDGSTSLAALPTVDSSAVTRPLETKMAMAVCQRNHYLTSDEGMRRIESDIGVSDVRFAGMPRGAGLLAYKPADGSPLDVLEAWISASLLPDGWARNYRVTWHRFDADGTLLSGPPTGHFTAYNIPGVLNYDGAPKDVLCNVAIPYEFGTDGEALQGDYFYRLWATRTFDTASSDTGGDEMFLINEAYVTAPDIAARYVTFADATPNEFLIGAPALNTNATNFPPLEAGLEQGIVNADNPPPLANDVCYWNDVLWAWDISYRSHLAVTLLSVDAPTGIQVGDNVLSFVGVAPGGEAVDTFVVETGLSSLQLNIQATARNIVEVLNRNLTTYTAFHTGVSVVQPGAFYLEAATPATTINFTSSRPDAFRPNFTVAVGSTSAASNTGAFSKPLRGDAWPTLNTLQAGPADARVLRAIPYRDRLLLFTDYGIYQVTGRSYLDFSVSPFDLTYRLIARESVCVCDDKVYAWCFEGIIQVDDSGVRVISTPIEPTVRVARDRAADSTFAQLAFAVAYRQKHRVMFWYPEFDDLTQLRGCGFWFVWDTRTECWSEGVLGRPEGFVFKDNRSTGVVRWSDDNLVLGNWNAGSTDAWLFVDRSLSEGPQAFTDDLSFPASPLAAEIVGLHLVLQYQTPNPSGAAHWQQTVINFAGGEFAAQPYPASISVGYLTEWEVGASILAQSTITHGVVRTEPPIEVRRGNRMQLAIANANEEYVGIVGISQNVSSPSRFIRAGQGVAL